MGKAAAQRHDMEIAGGQQLGEAIGRDETAEPEVGDAGSLLFQVAPHRAFSVDHERHVRELPGGGDEQVEGLRKADVAGVQHHGLVADPQLLAVPGHPVARVDLLDVDEVGDHPYRAGAASRKLAGHIGGEVVGQHRHRVRQAVADPLQPRRRGDDGGVGHRPCRHRSVREYVLDVEHARAPVGPGDDPSGDAHRQRR